MTDIPDNMNPMRNLNEFKRHAAKVLDGFELFGTNEVRIQHGEYLIVIRKEDRYELPETGNNDGIVGSGTEPRKLSAANHRCPF